MNMPNFAQAGQQLNGLRQQQSELAAAVESGQLWMEPDVAERAAARCEQAVDELHARLAGRQQGVDRAPQIRRERRR